MDVDHYLIRTVYVFVLDEIRLCPNAYVPMSNLTIGEAKFNESANQYDREYWPSCCTDDYCFWA